MRYSAATLSRLRTVAVSAFVVVGLLLFGLLWAKSGGSIPLITGGGYSFNAQFPNIENLAHASDVDMAGVPIGTVQALNIGKGNVNVHMILHRYGPLHQGAQVQIQDKTLINETFVEVTDGHGPKLPSGSTLPLSAAKNFTSLNTLFDSFQPPTQEAAKSLLTSFNSATDLRGADLNTLLSDLANVGAQGQTVFDVLAAQTTDLRQLVSQTGTLLTVLDEGQGQIGNLASTAEQVSHATATSQAALAQTVQTLPSVIDSAHNASGSIETLSSALTPVALNLQRAAPTLNQALITLPGTTRALRTVLPSLNSTLIDAPPTLKPLPTTAQDLTNLLPSGSNVLSNFNPVVGYLAHGQGGGTQAASTTQPGTGTGYAKDIAAFFANFNAAAASHKDSNSFYADVEDLTVGQAGGLPLSGVLQNLLAGVTGTNPYPAPAQSAVMPPSSSTAFPSVPQEKG
jgi:phospholipid/cholesterol/gamma-HCH transport system substrate-binding protein